jgi:hypothetical protein
MNHAASTVESISELGTRIGSLTHYVYLGLRLKMGIILVIASCGRRPLLVSRGWLVH